MPKQDQSAVSAKKRPRRAAARSSPRHLPNSSTMNKASGPKVPLRPTRRRPVLPTRELLSPELPTQELPSRARKKLEVDSSFIVTAAPNPEPPGSSNSTNLGDAAAKSNSSSSSRKRLSTKRSAKDKIFQDRLEQIKMFKLIHGHASPTQSFDAGLYRWCHRKRTSKSKLSQEQINELDAIGFNWDCKSYVVKTFEERIQELEEFKKIHNHCKVSVRYDPSLSVWCQHLKSSYRAISRGTSPHVRLEKEQIEVLSKMGFEW